MNTGIFSQISTEFCNWLKELPHGNDDTVNNTQPEKIRALFDTSAQKTEQVVWFVSPNGLASLLATIQVNSESEPL